MSHKCIQQLFLIKAMRTFIQDTAKHLKLFLSKEIKTHKQQCCDQTQRLCTFGVKGVSVRVTACVFLIKPSYKNPILSHTLWQRDDRDERQTEFIKQGEIPLCLSLNLSSWNSFRAAMRIQSAAWCGTWDVITEGKNEAELPLIRERKRENELMIMYVLYVSVWERSRWHFLCTMKTACSFILMKSKQHSFVYCFWISTGMFFLAMSFLYSRFLNQK